MAYRLGQVVGHPLGGYLAHPERHWSYFRHSAFWSEYPFVLPGFVASAMTAVVVVLGVFWIEEVRLSGFERGFERVIFFC